MAATTSLDSGPVRGPKRAMKLPSLPTKYLVKFQLGDWDLLESQSNRGWALLPVTGVFAYSGKVTS